MDSESLLEASQRRCADLADSLAVSQERLHESRQQLESERAARVHAERLSRLKDEFLSTLSHELRTPLNAILGWSQVLAAPGVRSEELDEGLQTIQRNARTQAQLIDDVLDLSRVMSGRIRLDVRRVDLAAVIGAAVTAVRPSADAKQLRLTVTSTPEAGSVSGDAARLQQVIWNLLSNAVKFTPRGGRVDVLLTRVGGHMEIAVTDNGQGMRPEFLPHVFDRFRQGEVSTARRVSGLGIGLAIVKNLVELHGGRVAAKSDGEGRGASFVVTLPVERRGGGGDGQGSAAAAADRLADDDLPNLSGVTVLVVDDEPDARVLLKRVLERRAARVMLAASAREALEMVHRQHPDVIVSDIAMPDLDGYELIRLVRSLPAEDGGGTPAIALTAFARSEDRRRAMLAGFQVHIAKPVESPELIATVASLTGRAGANG